MCGHFGPVRIPSILYATDDPSLECLPFLKQFLCALEIHVLGNGNTLKISSPHARARSQSFRLQGNGLDALASDLNGRLPPDRFLFRTRFAFGARFAFHGRPLLRRDLCSPRNFLRRSTFLFLLTLLPAYFLFAHNRNSTIGEPALKRPAPPRNQPRDLASTLRPRICVITPHARSDLIHLSGPASPNPRTPPSTAPPPVRAVPR
jgi:hypothetical protein